MISRRQRRPTAPPRTSRTAARARTARPSWRRRCRPGSRGRAARPATCWSFIGDLLRAPARATSTCSRVPVAERPLVDPEARVVVRELAPRARADERVAPGDLGQVGGEVVAAHDRVELGQRGRVDRLADERGRALVVDDRLVAELVVELVVGAVRGADAAGDLLDQHRASARARPGRTSASCRSASRRGPGCTFGASPAWKRADASRRRGSSGSIRRDDDVLQAASRPAARDRDRVDRRCAGARRARRGR